MFKIYVKLFKFNTKHRANFYLSFVTSIIGYGCQLVAPFTLGNAVNEVSSSTIDMNHVKTYLALTITLYIVGSIFVWFAGVFSQTYTSYCVKSLRDKEFEVVSKLPISYIDTNSTGEIMSRFVNDCDLVFDGLSQIMNQLFSASLTVILSVCFMFMINPMMCLVVVAITPIIFILSKTVTQKSAKQFQKQQALISKMNGLSEEYIENQQLLISYNYQDNAYQNFYALNEELNDVGQKAQFYSSISNPTTRIINNVTYILIGILGAVAFHYFGLTIGGLTSFFSYSVLFSKPFNEITSVFSQIIAGRIGLERIFTLIEEPVEDEPYAFHEEDIAKDGHITFDQVSFGYDKDKVIIHDFTANIPKESKIAIVGPTGAGKSTMINLLMRFYDINKGNIYLDDINIQQKNKEALRKSFGMVLQETWLFEGSIKENIAYGKPEASIEEIMYAAKQANIHDYIMSLNEGYDTIIYEGSTNISIGQKQLITIARALLLEPTCLILDEATSNIDSLSEKKIQETFTSLMRYHTSFYIAHRLSTVVDSDLILVMNKGSIVEQGTHRELMKKEGFYYNLYNSQFE